MERRLHVFATRPMIVRECIEVHQSWIENRIGVPISDAVIVDTDLNLCQLGVERVLDLPEHVAALPKSVRRLRSFVSHVDIPPGIPPLIEYLKGQPDPTLREIFGGTSQPKRSRTDWLDCPLALSLHTVARPVIALNIHYHQGPSSDCDVMANVLITPRSCLDQLIRLLDTVNGRESTPKLHTHTEAPGESHPVAGMTSS